MSKRYKITVITFVILAVLAILLVSDLAVFAPGEDEEAGPADEQFKTTEEPYNTYNEALSEGKPVVIEFYARW